MARHTFQKIFHWNCFSDERRASRTLMKLQIVDLNNLRSQALQDRDPLLKVCSVVHHTFYPLPHLILSIVCRQRKLLHFFYLNSFLLLHDQKLPFLSLYLISCFYTWQTLHPLISDSHCIHFHAQSILDRLWSTT